MVYAYLLGDADQGSREKFDAILFKPPPGTKAEVIRALPEWEPGAMGDSFMAQLNSRGGNAPGGARTAG